jgi:hypothetical protein
MFADSEDVKATSVVLLLAPVFFLAEGVCFASTHVAWLFALVILLASLVCLAWGIRIFRTHRMLGCVCILFAGLYVVAVVLLLQPVKVRANKRAGGDGGLTVLFHAGRAWPAAPQHRC